MRALHWVSRATLCGWMMTACATDPPATERDPRAADPFTMTDTSQVITIPRELMLQSSDGADPRELTGTTSAACHVTLLFCADPRLSPPIPSFCQNGGCTTHDAVVNAFILCDNVCGPSACNVIAQFPNSPGC